MTPTEFKRSLAAQNPPAGLSPALAALWWAGNDHWDKAHEIVMNEGGSNCAWVHAYLHWVEGDMENARYWYRQARREIPETDHAAEWAMIAGALLQSKSP